MQSWSSEEEAFAGSEKRTVHISKRMGEEEEEKEKEEEEEEETFAAILLSI